MRRLLALAWQFRGDCLWSLAQSLMLLLLGLAGLQLLGLVIDVIRHALDPAQRAPVYPFGWTPPAGWTPLQIVTVMALAIVVQAMLRAALTYQYNMTTARLTQGKIVPDLRDRVYAKLQRLSFRFFDVHGSSSIFNRVTGDVQNTRLFVDGVVLQGVNMVLTLAVYLVFMWRIHAMLTVACLSVTIGLWWVTHYYSGRLRPGYLRNRELFDSLVLLFTESVRGMQTTKGFAAEPTKYGGSRRPTGRCRTSRSGFSGTYRIFTPITQVLSQLSLVILFAYGGWLYVQGRIPLGGGLVVFAGLMQQFNGQVANITTIANSVQQSFTAARRVFEVLDTPLEVQNRPNADRASAIDGAAGVRGGDVRLPAGGECAGGGVVRGRAGPGDWHLRRDRGGQEHAAEPDPAVLRSPARAHPGGWAGPARARPGRLPAPDRHRLSGELPLLEHGGGEHRVRQPARDAGADRAGGPDRRRRTSSSWSCRMATRRCSGNRGLISRAGSGSGWRWRGRCCCSRRF